MKLFVTLTCISMFVGSIFAESDDRCGCGSKPRPRPGRTISRADVKKARTIIAKCGCHKPRPPRTDRHDEAMMPLTAEMMERICDEVERVCCSKDPVCSALVRCYVACVHCDEMISRADMRECMPDMMRDMDNCKRCSTEDMTCMQESTDQMLPVLHAILVVLEDCCSDRC